MTTDFRDILRRYYDALNRRDFDALDGLVVGDLVRHEPGAERGLAAFKDAIRMFVRGFPDLAHTVETMLIDGELAAVRTTTTGTHIGFFLGHPPTGRRFLAAGQTIFRFEGDKISESWGVFDTVTMLQQLGLYASVADTAQMQIVASTTKSVERLPPGPHEELSVAEVRSKPLLFLQGLTREYGDVVRYVCNGRVTILVNTPEAVRHVLHERASNYSKLATPDMLLLRPMLGDGLLTTEGPRWKSDRKWVQPLFTRRQIEGCAHVMVQATEEAMGRWDARSVDSVPLDVPREMSRLTLEIAARVLLSSNFASQSAAFGLAVDILNESMGHVEPGSAEVQARFQPALESIRSMVWQTILARQIYDTGEEDLVAFLLRAQRERGDDNRQMIDQAVTLLLAGHETTAKALAWIFALLDRHNDVADRLLEEQQRCLCGRPVAYDDLPTLPFTQGVIHEALRLYPPIWSLTRTALEDDTILGYTVPAGALITISPYLLHRNPAIWKRSDEFLPERFLGDEAEIASRACKYIPFGHGPRQCIGKQFALMELPLVLATIHPRQVLTRASGQSSDDLEPEALVTLRPRGGLLMNVSARPSSQYPLLSGGQT
jgi:steroid delta-isomerase-like uncharacterized protein